MHIRLYVQCSRPTIQEEQVCEGVEGQSIWGIVHLNDGTEKEVFLEPRCVSKDVPVTLAPEGGRLKR